MDDQHRTSRYLDDDTYVELVASLCGTRLPAAIMTALFAVAGIAAAGGSGDVAVATLVGVGGVASAARLLLLVRGRSRCDAGGMPLRAARRFERSFAIAYLGFAAAFGGFAARCLALPIDAWHTPVCILVVGYAAGAASTVALRPRIVSASLTLAVLPPTASLLLEAGDGDVASAICLLGLLVGGLRSVGQRYRSHTAIAAARRALTTLASTDHLTGIGNRMALTQKLDELRTSTATRLVRLHYIDLDDFKPVNDVLGHDVGDAVLRMAAARLSTALLPGDAVARVGGDEFVLVRADASEDAGEEDARCLKCLLDAPYDISGGSVRVGASIGSCHAPHAFATQALLIEADRELRARKSHRKRLVQDSSTESMALAHAA